MNIPVYGHIALYIPVKCLTVDYTLRCLEYICSVSSPLRPHRLLIVKTLTNIHLLLLVLKDHTFEQYHMHMLKCPHFTHYQLVYNRPYQHLSIIKGGNRATGNLKAFVWVQFCDSVCVATVYHMNHQNLQEQKPLCQSGIFYKGTTL